MSTLNLNNANALYYGDTQAQKLYKGSELLYPELNTDPYYNDVLLYLKGDDFTDSSPNPKTVNLSTGSIINTSIKKYGSGSLDFSINNSHILIPNNASVTNYVAKTIEFWYYPFSAFVKGLFQLNSESNSAAHSIASDDSKVSMVFGGGTTGNYLVNNTWQHLAFIFDNSQTKIYHNGVLVYTYNGVGSSLTNSQSFAIGRNYFNSTAYKANALFDSFRITNAIRYTSDFDPETDTYLAY